MGVRDLIVRWAAMVVLLMAGSCAESLPFKAQWARTMSVCQTDKVSCATRCKTEANSGGPACAFAAVNFIDDHKKVLETDPDVRAGRLPFMAMTFTGPTAALHFLQLAATNACSFGPSPQACEDATFVASVLATPPPTAPTDPSLLPFEGEASVTPVQPMPSIRQPAEERAPGAVGFQAGAILRCQYAFAAPMLKLSHCQVPVAPGPQAQGLREMQALRDSFTLSERLKAMPATDPHRSQFLDTRAWTLGALAQADFASEPTDRRGRLRAVALHAAITAYAEALTNIDWASDDFVARKDDFVYRYALLLEQAGDRETASATYKKLLSTATDDGHRGLSYLGLAMLAGATQEPTQQAAVPNEFHLALDIFERGERPESPSEYTRFVLDHVKVTYPEKWAEFQHERQERAKKLAAAAAEAEATAEIWKPVLQMADEIAIKRWLVEYFRKSHTKPERVIQQVAVSIVRQTAGGYCPAKRAFVAKKGAAEFTKRAMQHCKNEPPEASSTGEWYDPVRGSEMLKLPTQCQMTFATPCP